MHNLKKRLLSVLCSGAMIGTSLTAAVPYNSLIVRAEDNGVQQVIHVEVNGNDKTGDGSQEKPFATLARAQKAVREINGNMTGDIIVSVGAGDYYLDEAIQMDERDSGSNGFEVIWQGSNKSADDVSTRLIGGQDITGEGYQWKAATAEDEASGLLPGMAGKVYKIQLNPEDYQYFDYTNSDYMDDEDYPQGYYGHQGFNELYVNGEKAIMARSQNYRHYEDFENQRGDYWYAGGKTGGKSDSIYYKAGGGKAGPSASDVKGMADAQERGDRVIAQLVIWDAGDNDWVSNTIPIEKIDEGSRKLTAVQSPTTSLYPYNYQIPGTSTPLPKQGGPGLYRTKYQLQGGERYFLQGNLAFLDTPGEWFYYGETGELYYYPKEGENFTDTDIIVPTTQDIFVLHGSDKQDMMDYADEPDLAKQVSNVTIRHFAMECTESADWYSTGWNAFEGGDYVGSWYFYPPEAMVEGTVLPDACEWRERVQFRHGAVVMTNTNHITVENNYIKNMGQSGVVLDRDNTFNTIRNCVIEEVGLHGIYSDGGYPGVGAYNNNHTIDNLYIHNVGKFGAAAAGIHLWATGDSTFSHCTIDGAARRTICLEGGYQRSLNNGWGFRADWDKTYNPITQLYNFGNRFEYIYSTRGEQDAAEDASIFVDNMVRGDQIENVLGRGENKGDPALNTNPATGEPFGAEKHNTFYQVVSDLSGVISSSRDKNTVQGMDFAMGNAGMVVTDVKGTNIQNYQLRLEPNVYGGIREKFYLTNTNNNYMADGNRYFKDEYKSFDDSRMQYDKIGVTQEFPFLSAVENTYRFSEKPEENIYFSEDFESGKLDTSKWTVEKGTPSLSNHYMSEGPLKGSYSLQLVGKDSRNFGVPANPDGVTVSRTFDEALNKVVTVNFFDRHQSRATSEFIAGTKYTRSFVRVDDGENEVAIGSYQDYNGTNDSQDFFYIKDGDKMIRTDAECTFGWHQFKFDYSNPGTVDLYIDNTKVGTLERDSFNYLSMYSLAGHNDNYIDQIYVYGGKPASTENAPTLPLPTPPEEKDESVSEKFFEDNFEKEISESPMNGWNSETAELTSVAVSESDAANLAMNMKFGSDETSYVTYGMDAEYFQKYGFYFKAKFAPSQDYTKYGFGMYLNKDEKTGNIYGYFAQFADGKNGEKPTKIHLYYKDPKGNIINIPAMNNNNPDGIYNLPAGFDPTKWTAYRNGMYNGYPAQMYLWIEGGGDVSGIYEPGADKQPTMPASKLTGGIGFFGQDGEVSIDDTIIRSGIKGKDIYYQNSFDKAAAAPEWEIVYKGTQGDGNGHEMNRVQVDIAENPDDASDNVLHVNMDGRTGIMALANNANYNKDWAGYTFEGKLYAKAGTGSVQNGVWPGAVIQHRDSSKNNAPDSSPYTPNAYFAQSWGDKQAENRWYSFKIVCYPDTIETYIDEVLVKVTASGEELRNGTVGFKLNGGEYYFDDLKVYTSPMKKTENPKASLAGGAVRVGASVTLTAQNGADIFYTTDGSNPKDAEHGIYYAGQKLAIDKAMTLKYVAIVDGCKYSDVMEETYTIDPEATATVTYVANDEIVATQTLKATEKNVADMDGGKGKLPEYSKAGYEFIGWYLDKDKNGNGMGTKFTDKMMVGQDITVYAKLVKTSNTSIVKFLNDCASYASKYPEHGTAVNALPKAPTKEGYTFEGWFTGFGGTGEEFDVNTKINENTVLFAKWTPNETPADKTITYMDGDNEVTTQKVVYPNRTAKTLADAPEKAGFEFVGWFTEAGEQFTGATVVDEDVTVYAQWAEKEQDGFKITVDGKVLGFYQYNDAVTIKAAGKDGHKFAGWEVNGEIVSYEETYKFYVSNEMEFTAKYVPAEETVDVKAKAMLTNAYATKRQDGKSDVKFVGELIIPEGYKIVKAGLIWSSKPEGTVDLITGEEGNKTLNPNLRPTYITRISDTNQFSVTIKGMPSGKFIRGVIFAEVKDADGQTKLIYSAEQKVEAAE